MRDTIVNQRTWRTIGLAALGICFVMAWYGVKPGVMNQALPVIAVYWGIFLLSLLIALYMALLDLRYIRLLFLQEEKELFEDTLGSEEFRRALRERLAERARPEDDD